MSPNDRAEREHRGHDDMAGAFGQEGVKMMRRRNCRRASGGDIVGHA